MAAAAVLSATAPVCANAAGLPVFTKGPINHVLVIDLENESESTWYKSSSMPYTNSVLLQQGEFITNYYATSHVSLGNYVSQVSGQEPTFTTNNDCINLASLSSPPVVGAFNTVTPGNDDPNPTAYPGQVDGDGCVYPAPTATTHGAQTIGDQLDAKYAALGIDRKKILWREYAEDMGFDPARDHGDADSDGVGNDCAHPAVGGDDLTNTAEATDQYADRHNPFLYFHSVIDNAARCDSHVSPLGTAVVDPVNPSNDVFVGHLHDDLMSIRTTPKFMFVTPNLCNDGHDATCHGKNIEGGSTGGLVAADLWLKHYMPMIFASQAYQNGSLMVAIVFDEAGATDSTACPNTDQSTCGSPVGPNVTNPGFSYLLSLYRIQTTPTQNYVYPGGGQVGAIVFNKRYVKPGSVNATGVYNHYSALRTYEDLLGVNSGGDDGQGHLGYASGANVASFGLDVFNMNTK